MIFEQKNQAIVVIIVYIWLQCNSVLNAMEKGEMRPKTPVSILRRREDQEKWKPENMDQVEKVLSYLHAKKRMRRSDSEQWLGAAVENTFSRSFSFGDFASLENKELKKIDFERKKVVAEQVVVAITGFKKLDADIDLSAGSAYE